ncbi:AAA domain-containing protein [Micromonospora sp. NPDC005367]|uniref:AAA domain-containing protein n=1 Tax=Micromonospora sp. NPDC005367 TaxID=3155590 RepID=UPI0033B7F2A6
MTDDVDRLIHHLCVDPATARYGPYTLPPTGDTLPRGVDLLPGRLRRYRLIDRVGKAVDLHAYVGLAEVGGQLWEQEVRVLLRLGASGQDALPEVLDGGYEEPEATAKMGSSANGVAVIAAAGSDRTLADPGAAAWMRSQPALALAQFQRLAEALAELHDLGVLHRNLVPGSILADTSTGARIWIARFEMSALIGNLLRRSVDSTAQRSELRTLFLGPGAPDARTLSCQPFERLAFLCAESSTEPLRETPTSDVYSLAAVVWDWFCDATVLDADPLPDDLVARHREIHRRMIAALSGDEVPSRLAALLRAMLDERPANRPTTAEVCRQLAVDVDTIMWHLLGAEPERPYLVVDIPRECIPTLAGWQWLGHSTDTPESRDELAAWMHHELANAKLMHSINGAVPFVRTGGIEERRQARTVLVGRSALWFCQHYQRRAWGSFGPPLDNALIIKYVAAREHPSTRRVFEELRRTSAAVDVPAIEVVNMDVADSVMDAQLAGRPSWKPLRDRLTDGSPDQVAHHEYAAALDWLLSYQGAELNARTYAYVRTDTSPHRVTIEWEPDRERRYVNSDALLTKFVDSPWLRPAMGDFFLGIEDDDQASAGVEILPDRGGRPGSEPIRSVWTVVPERLGDDRIVLHRSEGTERIPERGWIRPRSDRGQRAALARQAAARLDLTRTRGLLSQLRSPRSVRLRQRRWAHAGDRLQGELSRAVVRDLLTHRPFYAVQGPPGTGKTTVVSEAVASYLVEEPAARVLISAQSGHALDNLAQRILHRVGELGADGAPTDRMDLTAMRVMSRSGSLPHQDIMPWTRNVLAVRSAERTRRRVDEVLAGDVRDDLRDALLRWRGLLDPATGENVLPELGDRLERSANLVFATCVTATPQTVTPGGTRSRFDWVIVEEAAKAWPTELAMPLTCGTSWTLVGDHRQLGAHRRADFERFIDSCVGDPAPELAMLAEQREVYLGAFDTLRQLFDRLPDTESERGRLPLRQLTTQFRMREPIAQVVSRVFYPVSDQVNADGLPPGLLHTGADIPAAPIRSPEPLRGQSLVWLDTRDVPDCSDEPRWINRGEARLLAALVDHITPRPQPRQHGYSSEPLAVLSPYRAQARLLQQHDALRPYISTIHAFQGREADVVLVSLVRDRRHGPAGVAWSSLGHLAQPNLINVMLSRARRLLVIVGNFQHFRNSDGDVGAETGATGDGPFWGRLCSAIEHYGVVLPAAEVIEG